jgi:hypothetical protein
MECGGNQHWFPKDGKEGDRGRRTTEDYGN